MRPIIREYLKKLDVCIQKLPKKGDNNNPPYTSQEMAEHTRQCIAALNPPQLVDKHGN